MDISQYNVGAIIVPAAGAFTITPNDSVDLDKITRAIVVGASGNVNAVMANGDSVVFVGLVGGLVYPFQIKKILNSSTTASGLVGLY